MFSKEKFANISLASLSIPASPPETLRIVYSDETTDLVAGHPQKAALLPFGRSELQSSCIKNGQLKTTLPSSTREIYEFRLEVPGSWELRPGDSIGIFPRNNLKSVDALIAHQNWADPDTPVKLEFLPECKKKKALQFVAESGSTIRQILSECVDLQKPPSKLLLLAMVKYCPTVEIQNILKFLCAKENMPVYTQEIMEKRVTVQNLLLELAIKIPFGLFLEHSHRLLPRPYSIINGTSKGSGQVRIAFSWNEAEPGLTTSMLRDIINWKSNELIHFYLRQPTVFRLHQEDLDRNLIMIGPGLGAIPFLGMLEELEFSKANTLPFRIIFTSWRQRDNDDVFREEFVKSAILNELYFSYTREDPNATKDYVQDLIVNKAKQIGQLLQDSNTKVFICGEGKSVIPQIEVSLANCLNHLQPPENQKFIKELKAMRRIVIEEWF